MTLKNIINVYGTGYEWLYHGTGDMIQNVMNLPENTNENGLLQIASCTNQKRLGLKQKNRSWKWNWSDCGN